MYVFARERHPVVVIGLAEDGEVRIVDRDGNIRRVAEHRIKLLELPAAMAVAIEVAA